VTLIPVGTPATVWPIVAATEDRWWWWLWSNRWNANWQGKPKYSEKTCRSTRSKCKSAEQEPSSKAQRSACVCHTFRFTFHMTFLFMI
jgi:hypothetical protein